MAFEPKEFSFILQRMIDRVVARSELTDVEEGGAVHTVLSSVAREIDDVNFQMVNLQDAWDIDTATGEELDQRAADIPGGVIVRQGESKALTTLVFSRTGTTGTITIPAGTVARVPEGGPAFQTTASGSIGNGNTVSAAIAAEAVEAGSAGNTDLGTVTQLDGLAGVEFVTNTTAAAGGQDEESDDQLRERMRGYYRSLPRGTPTALEWAVRNVAVDGFGRVTTAQVVEFPGVHPGVVEVYADDGQGTIERRSDNYSAYESIIAAATGGEKRFTLGQFPVHESFLIDVKRNGVSMVRNTDYRLDPTTGLVILDETVFPTGLTLGDAITAGYTWYVGLIGEAQKVINGDPTDRANYPGYKAAGCQVFVLPPAVTQLAVTGVLTADPNYQGTLTDLKTKVKSAITRYVNGLGIGDDVIYTELVFAAQSIPGVRDISFTNPTANVTVGEGELIRVTSSNILLT